MELILELADDIAFRTGNGHLTDSECFGNVCLRSVVNEAFSEDIPVLIAELIHDLVNNLCSFHPFKAFVIKACVPLQERAFSIFSGVIKRLVQRIGSIRLRTFHRFNDLLLGKTGGLCDFCRGGVAMIFQKEIVSDFLNLG